MYGTVPEYGVISSLLFNQDMTYMDVETNAKLVYLEILLIHFYYFTFKCIKLRPIYNLLLSNAR